MQAISLHGDVIVLTSQLLQAHCTVVRGPHGAPPGAGSAGGAQDAHGERAPRGEVFIIDSPVLPEELAMLPSLLERSGFPPPSGLLATHGDWDHLLGRIAFPGVSLGCAKSTAARLRAEPGAAQRELRAFDEALFIERDRPLALGARQALAVPGRCGLGAGELELHPADGHTADGMAVWIPWARVLVPGDYLSAVELPALDAGDTLDAYLATLERLRALLAGAEHVVPGHGPLLDRARALQILEEDVAYLRALRAHAAAAELPAARRSPAQRERHAQNVAALAGG